MLLRGSSPLFTQKLCVYFPTFATAYHKLGIMLKYLNSTYTIPVLAGLLFASAFLPLGTGLASIFAFVLLLILHEKSVEKSNKSHFYRSVYGAFILFNIIACGWIINASVFGGVSEVIINSFFMSIPWVLYSIGFKTKGQAFAKLILFVSWLAFEYIHTNWELEWPWLHLGNGFANQPFLVQWYEYTGVLGGTAWVLLSALSMHAIYKRFVNNAHVYVKTVESLVFSLLVFIPILISLAINIDQKTQVNPIKTLVVQPNFDPYKGDNKTPKQRFSELITLTKNDLTEETGLVLWPEISIDGGIWEHAIESHPAFKGLASLSQSFPSTDFIIGTSTFKHYQAKEASTVTARKYVNKPGYYDVFNSLLHIRNGELIAIRHKSKLVIGVEKIPFPGFMSLFTDFIRSLGGSAGSLGADEELNQFLLHDSVEINSLVCYESVFGEYASSAIPDIITVHTNDGWWGNTQGHKQHFSYSRLRAIENRRYVARSAYNGISGFLAPDGSVLQSLGYEKVGALSENIYAIKANTFYQKHGDFIGRWALFFSVLLLLYLFIQIKLATKENVKGKL